MNMHGIMTPIDTGDERRSGTTIESVREWIWARRWFMLIVVLPTLLVAGYLYLIASDQYESEAHFLVRSTNVAPVPASGVSEAISMVTGASAAQNEAMSVADYLTSHDVVAALRQQDQLVERFHRPGVDFLSRLRTANPTPEKLLKFYRQQVKVKYNTETGIATLQVRTFEPQDSYDLARKLLQLGEQRVNTLNVRSYNDSISMSRRQLAEAEAALTASQSQMTAFRRDRGDIDPETSGKAQITLVAQLTAQLAAARAQLNAMGGMIAPSSPQYRAVAARVSALQAQVDAQNSRLATGNRAIANDISGYQGLDMRRQFLAKRYEAAAASLDKARDQALRQQLYLVRVVDANMPVKALYPERFRILATIVIALLLTYSIGWLIAAGVREHAA